MAETVVEVGSFSLKVLARNGLNILFCRGEALSSTTKYGRLGDVVPETKENEIHCMLKFVALYMYIVYIQYVPGSELSSGILKLLF